MSLEDKLYPLLGLYQKLPDQVRYGIGALYRALPETLRLGKRYPEFKQLAHSANEWSVDEAEEYQLKQLRKVLNQAAAYCPFYQRTFAEADFRPDRLKTTADMARCPLLTKDDLLTHLPEMVSTAIPESARLYITTGGSTGVPVGFYLQKGVSRPKEQAFLETMWERAGYFSGARLAVIRGHVTTDKAGGKIEFYDATRGWLMLSSYHLAAERLPEYLAAIERFKPDLLHAYPSAALLLAEFLETQNITWKTPLKGLLCGSERLTIPQKRLLERVFRCRVYRWYGHSERVVLAGEGVSSELFYFFPQYGFAEFGPPDDEGLCEVIGTSFHNMTMPLIRYRTGDRVRLAAPDAPREFPWPAAEEIAGREQEFLVSRTGRKISLTAFNMHDSVFDGLYAVQFHQAEPGAATLRYLPGPSFNRAALREIESKVRRKLGDDFELKLLEVKEVEKTARGKHRWLVSELP